ncbi:MAG: hypothetical protein R6X12_00715 [bacterium]
MAEETRRGLAVLRRNLEDVRPYGCQPGFGRRHVRHDGCIWLQNKAGYPAVLGTTSLGLESLAESTWRVWFCDLPIGVVKPVCARLICQSEA